MKLKKIIAGQPTDFTLTKLERTTLTFGGIHFPALDVMEANLLINRVANKVSLNIVTKSHGTITHDCPADDVEQLARLRKLQGEFIFLVQAGKDFRHNN